MHISNLHKWQHAHHFNIDAGRGEQNTRRVIVLTVGMMVIEIIAGYWSGSMALLADGWHMGTHAVALGITVFAYYYARRHADNPTYSFGTGKVGVLGGYTSAVILAVVAGLMLIESGRRLLAPVPIRFNEAIGVAVVGLAVNLVSALLLQGRPEHDHEHGVHHHDHNLRAAYLHVLADAMTSLLAIIALLAGKTLGWQWLDPVMGLAGALLIMRWAHGLLADTSRILLDRALGRETMTAIRAAVEADADNRVTDLHIWPVGAHHFAAIISVVTHYPRPPAYYKEILNSFAELEHVTVEVNHCLDEPCLKISG